MTETKVLPISLWLQPSPKFNLLWCMICRRGMHLRVEGYPKQVIFGDAAIGEGAYKPLKFPIKYKCTTKSDQYGDCPALWIIQGFIDENE